LLILHYIVFGNNVLSNKKIILVGVGKLIKICGVVESLVAGPLQQGDDFISGAYEKEVTDN
jgi:hypothetical protein